MTASSRRPFVHRVAHLHAEFVRSGLPVSDMRRAPTLELQLAGVSDASARSTTQRQGIEPLEGPIEARPVPKAADGTSRLRFFLDGAQRTFLVWRCGLVPIAATVAAAAVLERDEHGRCEVAPGTLRLEHALLIPRRLNDPQLTDLLARVDVAGIAVVDPLASIEDESDYAALASDYSRLVELAYVSARHVRATLELDLLHHWGAASAKGDDRWIVVDGRLHRVVPRALGLVKQFSDSYLGGPDAETLLGLAPGHRTTAFCPSDRYRGALMADDGTAGPGPDARTLWYLRLHDAAGLDARHALIRLEAGPEVRSTEQIDEISAWVLAERTPRATNDARWATLLYPVHYLERILKRSLENDTRGWPGQ